MEASEDDDDDDDDDAEYNTAVARLGVHGRRNSGPEAVSQKLQLLERCKSELPEAKRRRKKEGETGFNDDAANAAPPLPHALREGNSGPGANLPTEHFPERWETAANIAIAAARHGSQNSDGTHNAF